LALPTYPFQRKRYWAKAAEVPRGKRRIKEYIHPLLGEKHSLASKEITFEGELDIKLLPYLADHQVYEQIIFPGAGYVEMALAAGNFALEQTNIVLEDFSIEEALLLHKDKTCPTQVILLP